MNDCVAIQSTYKQKKYMYANPFSFYHSYVEPPEDDLLTPVVEDPDFE